MAELFSLVAVAFSVVFSSHLIKEQLQLQAVGLLRVALLAARGAVSNRLGHRAEVGRRGRDELGAREGEELLEGTWGIKQCVR